MKAHIRTSLTAALTAVLVAGAAVTIPAIATTDVGPEDSTTEQSTEDGDAAGPRGLPGRVGHRLVHGLEQGELAERLAAELDLDTETVQNAFDAVRSDLAAERLNEAVEAGHLTQDQADEILERVEEGEFPGRRGPRGRRGPGGPGFGGPGFGPVAP